MRPPLVLQPQAPNDTKFDNVHLITCADRGERKRARDALSHGQVRPRKNVTCGRCRDNARDVEVVEP